MKKVFLFVFFIICSRILFCNTARLPLNELEMLNNIVEGILSFTNLHPYYTQQLSAQVWELVSYENIKEGVVAEAINKIVLAHDLAK